MKNLLLSSYFCIVFALQTLTGCKIYNQVPTPIEEITSGQVKPVQLITRDGNILKFLRLEQHGGHLFGVKQRNIDTLMIYIPVEKIHAIRIQQVKVKYLDGDVKKYKYLLVENGRYYGIMENRKGPLKTEIPTASVEGIYLLNVAPTNISNIVIIVGSTVLITYLFFPIMSAFGLLAPDSL